MKKDTKTVKSDWVLITSRIRKLMITYKVTEGEGEGESDVWHLLNPGLQFEQS